jgi:two-component system phosphate regulon sensor histidine kinase PhoR
MAMGTELGSGVQPLWLRRPVWWRRIHWRLMASYLLLATFVIVTIWIVLRASLPESASSKLWTTLFFAGLVAVSVAGVLGFVASRFFTKPLSQMGEVALRIARGDFSSRIDYPLADELGLLGDSLDHLSHELSEKIRLLTEEKTRLSTILSSMAEGVLMVNARGEVGLINQATQQMFGLTGVDIEGKPVAEVISTPEILKAFERTRALRAPTFEECFIVRGSDRRDLLISSTPIEEHGRLLGMVAVLNDISQVRRLERVRRDFVANVSHELRTPLSVVRGYAETLLNAQIELPDMAVEFMETILRHTIRLSRLIDDLLTLAAIEGRGLDSHLGPLDAHDVVLEVTDLLAKLAEDRQISVVVEGFDGLPQVRAEARALRHVLTNLLDNAIKYTQPEGKVRIYAAHKPTKHAVLIHVQDTGPGIAAEHLPRIFERFYRVDPGRSRDVGGSGLGLSLVKHLVHTLGASIDVHSALGSGTTFTLTLPCA